MLERLCTTVCHGLKRLSYKNMSFNVKGTSEWVKLICLLLGKLDAAYNNLVVSVYAFF